MSQNTQSMKTHINYIYQILNKITNKSYIGKSIDYKKRFETHLKNAKNKVNRRLYDSINFHGSDNFELILLETINSKNKQEIDEREKLWICKLNTLVPNGYNMTSGGDGGNTIESWDEIKKQELYKRQAKNRGKVFMHPDVRKNAVEKTKITKSKWSEEKKKEINLRISKTLKDKGIKPKCIPFPKGCIGFFKGKTHSLETKNKLKQYRKGKKLEDIVGEQKAKIIKNKLKYSFTGENNPKYVCFTKQEKLDILNLILENKSITFKQLTIRFNKSKYILRNFLKSIQIPNFQKFKQNFKICTIIEGINYVNTNC